MFLIANWKLNKTRNEAFLWINEFASKLKTFEKGSADVEIIISPSYILIPDIKEKSLEFNIKVAAQSVSKFDKGSYTGEVSASQLKDYAEYVIIGHSERKIFNETLTDAIDKIHVALANNLKPIVCFSNADEYAIIDTAFDANDLNKMIFAFEPTSAIGTGNPASKDEVLEIEQKTGLKSFIYGGSVDENNIHEFLELDCINGFLVGSASLNSEKFFSILKSICA